ncbi:hypothetical protein HDF08_000475 [Edaphobacter lichenicola]|uniref:Uncharacterized protein n=1 Tax=Tunturiibacter lichenicola TaxID=2051959 RepID=A0A852V5W2_9BACT|nr:hypothetical protein [Edaphobacter lichenicola]
MVLYSHEHRTRPQTFHLLLQGPSCLQRKNIQKKRIGNPTSKYFQGSANINLLDNAATKRLLL